VRDLAALPKAHLHIHLEGGMRPGTLHELATAADLEVPPVRGYGSFAAFAGMYLAACQVLRAPDDLRRLVDELVADAAAAGAAWVEPSFYPPNHNARLGPDEAVLEVVLDELRASAGRHGIGAGLMVAADRTADPARALDQARLAARYAGEGVVAFGLVNDEAAFPPEPFAQAYAVARDAGLLATPHAGELAGPASVLGALDALGAQRVQHGEIGRARVVLDPKPGRAISRRQGAPAR
jgi:adenosine deaminase